jgi:hypothetical protein
MITGARHHLLAKAASSFHVHPMQIARATVLKNHVSFNVAIRVCVLTLQA